ncbi:MAG: hypothetical protein ABIV25_04415 [Paracoccaceae bacterium]
MSALLTGALALPLASMASDAGGILSSRRPVGLPLVQVQDDGGGGDAAGPSDDADASADDPADAEGISQDETDQIVENLSSGTTFCQAVGDPALNVDCLSDQFAAAAKAMPAKGGYGDARKALLDAAAKLHALAAANAAPGKPAAKVKAGNHRSSRPLTAVANPAAVAAKAAAIVQETKLVLLRSSSGSDQRRIAYEQVAAVVNSTKVLLRSA